MFTLAWKLFLLISIITLKYLKLSLCIFIGLPPWPEVQVIKWHIDIDNCKDHKISMVAHLGLCDSIVLFIHWCLLFDSIVLFIHWCLLFDSIVLFIHWCLLFDSIVLFIHWCLLFDSIVLFSHWCLLFDSIVLFIHWCLLFDSIVLFIHWCLLCDSIVLFSHWCLLFDSIVLFIHWCLLFDSIVLFIHLSIRKYICTRLILEFSRWDPRSQVSDQDASLCMNFINTIRILEMYCVSSSNTGRENFVRSVTVTDLGVLINNTTPMMFNKV